MLTLPTNAIDLLEENHRINLVKRWFSAIFIIFITFAIPTTITQLYRNNLVGSSASGIQPTKTLQSFSPTTTPTIVHNSFQISSLFSYWWFLLILIGIIVMWAVILVAFFKQKSDQDQT